MGGVGSVTAEMLTRCGIGKVLVGSSSIATQVCQLIFNGQSSFESNAFIREQLAGLKNVLIILGVSHYSCLCFTV